MKSGLPIHDTIACNKQGRETVGEKRATRKTLLNDGSLEEMVFPFFYTVNI